MTSELRRGFHDQIAMLHQRVVDMARTVVEGVGQATTALLDQDAAAAAAVIEADRFVDEAYPLVEADVFDAVARQAPVARDLRFLIATQRVAQSVERAGDLVASIARRAGRIDVAALTPPVRDHVRDIGALVQSALNSAAECYAVLDAERAGSLPPADDAIDELQRRLLRAVVASSASSESVESAIELAMVARFYERIGDHAVVIAERVRFVGSGEMNAGDNDEAG